MSIRSHDIMKSHRNMKMGLFFTIDALIAALIMISGIILITSSYVSEQPKTMKSAMSQDMLNILAELKVYEVNNSYIQALVSNGSIKDVNSSLLQQIGEFWSNNSMDLAGEFAQNVTEGMLPDMYGYSVIFDNSTIYTRMNPVQNSLVTSKRITTGIEKSKPIKGYIAKARANTVRKTTSLVIPFSPEGAGWSGTSANPGKVEITRTFSLPNVTLINVSAYVSLHLDRGSSNWNVVSINNGRCNITRNDLSLPAGDTGVFKLFRLNSSCFTTGSSNNTIKLDLRCYSYNAHIHPGMFFVLYYNQTEAPQDLAWDHSQRIYFDNVNSTQGASPSGAGPWSVVPFHIPTQATNISVFIQVAGRGIRDYTASCTSSTRFSGWGGWRCFRDYDYMIFLNNITPFDSKANPVSNPLYFYNSSQTRPRIVNGTNIVSVYFNNYEDSYWGQSTEMIYSDVLRNASGSSYVEVNYSSPPAVPYGVIEIRRVSEFNGTQNPTKDSNFTFPSGAQGVSSVLLHPVEIYSYITRAYSDTGFPPAHKIFESPSSRAVPAEIYIPLWTIDPTPLMRNYVRLQETSGNDVLPNSTIDYGFYIKSFVGYGPVFATPGEAIDDAKSRLNTLLGSYVNTTDLVIDNTTMSGVPSLWGPVVAEVRVWD